MRATGLMLAAAFAAASAFAQQSTDIRGADFSSGKADATLAALGRRAALEGKRLVVTAPQDWHAAIEAKIRAGGRADVVLRDGFYESVLVRIEDKPAASAKAVDADKARARAEPKRAVPAAAAPAAARGDAAIVPSTAVAPAPAPTAAAALPAMPVFAAPAPAAARSAPPQPVPIADANDAATPAVVDAAAVRARMEQALLGGRRAEGSLPVASLRAGDVLYVDGPVRGVVRREGLRPLLYWLDGELDLRRAELKPLATNRYQVFAAIRGDAVLRADADASATRLRARVPEAGSAARAELERRFNDGKPIGDRMETDRLRSGDVLYVADGAAIVVRREGAALRRYWLDGAVDLRQSGVQADGPNRYRVLGDALR
ncbi:MAG TPA: hypothetical protein VGC30_07660 [Dokdonella sp.]